MDTTESAPKSAGKSKSVLAGRQMIARAHHARVAEPMVRSLLAQMPEDVPVVTDDAVVLEALKVMADHESGAGRAVASFGIAESAPELS